MSLQLSENEKELYSVDLHWSSYIKAAFFAFMGAIFLLIGLIGSSDPKAGSEIMFILSAFCFMPLLFTWLKNKCKTYSITDRRLYIEEGIIAKDKRDIPFNKINDVLMKQGIFQRMFGSGDVHVHTGNDKPTIVRDVSNPNQFKDHIFNATQKLNENKVA